MLRITRPLLTAATLAFVVAPLVPAPTEAQETPADIVRRVLDRTPLIDGHNDLPWAIRNSVEGPHDVEAPAHDLRGSTPFHTDIARLHAGSVGAQFWSVYIPYDAVEEGAAKVQLEQIDIGRQIIDKYPEAFGLALTASDLEAVYGEGRIASMLGMEGGHAIENSLGSLRAFYDLGVRYMTLTHNGTLDWADACCDEERHGGLTDFGREVVREMNRMGMLVDISHTSPATMNDVLDVAEAPVIWSHASARGVHDHPRNVPDQVLRRLPENGGVVMVTFVPSFLTSNDQATIADVADHIEHIAALAGIDHVGIGSDYDGIESTPVGLEDVSKFPALFEELVRRGWSEDELAKLAGENVLRAWREAEEVARILQRQRPPSTRTIEDMDGLIGPEDRGTGELGTAGAAR
ncbi:MAG: membrane dipeptidase [Gemmatimonadetes bacterium]|nr:membrane dipeptidase [Gemmatimonadota bacterium]NNL30665.1 membrane dipeptidase [Gemmatimonadota bacterium]